MASRSVSAILWTLVSVNALTLVVGGLVTWLGYAIPARLTQFGLLPELVIVAGLASLAVACLGLCALNYSSHYALNIYGFSCLIFFLMLLLGIPENWYKSSQFVDGALLMDILYFSLLSILLVLLVFALTFAQYLRGKELNLLEQPPASSHQRRPTGCGSGGSARDQLLVDGGCDSPICTCNLPLNTQSSGAGTTNASTNTIVTSPSSAANNDNSTSRANAGLEDAVMSNSAAKATPSNDGVRAERWFPWTCIGFGNTATPRTTNKSASQRNTSINTNNHLMGELSSIGFMQPQPQLTNGNGNGNSSTSSNNGGLCPLSEIRVPFYSSANSSNINNNNNSNHRPNRTNNSNISSNSSTNPCCTRANNNISSSSSSNAAGSMLNEKMGPLIHKGFYQRIGADYIASTPETGAGLIRAESFSRPVMAADQEGELNDDADESDARMLGSNQHQFATTNYSRLHRSASNHCIAPLAASRDDSLIYYGRQEHRTQRLRHHHHQQRANNSGVLRQPIIVSTTAAWPGVVGSRAALAQYAPATLGKCSCYSNSEIEVNRITSPHRDTYSSLSPSNARPITNCKHPQHNHRHLHRAPPLYQQQQQLHGLRSQNQHRYLQTQQKYTTPRFNNSTSTYAITKSANRLAIQQQQHGSRSKGSSSVVAAMTAATATALFGGLNDANSLMNPGEGIRDGLFAGLGDADADTSLVDPGGHCLKDSFDMNDHQHLDVSMLDAPVAITNITMHTNTNNTFQQNVLRQPRLGLAPLLEFGRKP